jgi:hypothetical protein
MADLIGGEGGGDTVDASCAGATPSYPLVRLAVITAIVAAASPYQPADARLLAVTSPFLRWHWVPRRMDAGGGVALASLSGAPCTPAPPAAARLRNAPRVASPA